METGMSSGGHIVGIPVCLCGYRGNAFDIEEVSERKAFDAAVMTHRLQVSIARGMSCFIIGTGLLWFAAITAGAIWLFRAIAGW